MEAFDTSVIIRKMQDDGASELAVSLFLKSLEVFRSGAHGAIRAADLSDLGPIPTLTELGDYTAAGRAALCSAVAINLNGGLGTTMGLEHAKSLITAKDGHSFLDIIIHQTLALRRRYRVPLPLMLMNSFMTEDDTLEALNAFPELEMEQPGLPLCFTQNRVPRLNAGNLMPVAWPDNPLLEWCPPGHADIYTVLHDSGLLAHLLNIGFQYAFVSNADNLGAELDLNILGYVAQHQIPFLMEVTTRTEADKKGGHLARGRDGRLLLRESAQCPPDEINDFQDVHKHRYFNTNNLWLNLPALKRKLDAVDAFPALPLIVNRKITDPARPDSPEVIQLEAAMGAAIGWFTGAQAIDVPRARFAPVKSTNDLLVVWSDVYELSSDFRLRPQPGRAQPPLVNLEPAFYKNMADFQARFPCGAPSLRECESLEVKGDFVFGRDIRMTGRVRLENGHAQQVRIPDGTVLRG